MNIKQSFPSTFIKSNVPHKSLIGLADWGAFAQHHILPKRVQGQVPGAGQGGA